MLAFQWIRARTEHGHDKLHRGIELCLQHRGGVEVDERSDDLEVRACLDSVSKRWGGVGVDVEVGVRSSVKQQFDAVMASVVVSDGVY